MVVKALHDGEVENKYGGNFLGYIIDANKGTPKCEKGKAEGERSVGFVDDEEEIENLAEEKKWTEDQVTAHAMMFLISRE